MGSISFGVPKDLVLAIRSEFNLENFIETGTYFGQTAAWASTQFRNVHTIEAARPLYDLAIAKLGSISNINFHFGDSRSCLKRIVAELSGASLYWLDAHWSGGPTHGAGDECPLLDEIGEINRSPAKSVIFIDDARLFLAPPPKPHNPDQWPDIRAVIQALSKPGEDRYVIVVEDVIVAVPAELRGVLIRYVQGRIG